MALIVSLFSPLNISAWISVILLFSNLGMAFFLLLQKHIPLYKQGQITRIKLARSILFDILGLLLTICVASYFGLMAGGWASAYGTWAGLVVGVAVGFSAAWLARETWVRMEHSVIARIP